MLKGLESELYESYEPKCILFLFDIYFAACEKPSCLLALAYSIFFREPVFVLI